MDERRHHDVDEAAYGQRSGDGRQQAWTGADGRGAVDRDDQPGVPLADRAKPQPDGLRTEPDDTPQEAGSGGRTRAAASGAGGLGTAEPRRPVTLTDSVPVEPNSADETNSTAGPADPTTFREDVLNTSDSSGLHPEDPASGRPIEELARRGATEISRMD